MSQLPCKVSFAVLWLHPACLTRRHQRHPGDAERHGHQRHRRNAEAVFQGAAGASAHRPPVPGLHGGHRWVRVGCGFVISDRFFFLPFVLDERHQRGLKLKSGSHMFLSPSLVALSDPAAKENCMMHLLRTLPDPNLMTFLTLLEHLKRYRSHTHTPADHNVTKRMLNLWHYYN